MVLIFITLLQQQQQQQQFIINFDTELTVVLPANSEN